MNRHRKEKNQETKRLSKKLEFTAVTRICSFVRDKSFMVEDEKVHIRQVCENCYF